MYEEQDMMCESESDLADDEEVYYGELKELKPFEQWKRYKEEGGFYDYGQWLIENGYMKVEQWAPIPEFEGLYEASDMGRIKNAWTGRVLKQHIDNKGYMIVSLKALDKKCVRKVHRLVASTFIDEYYAGIDIYHKDGDKTNNRLSNLECRSKS